MATLYLDRKGASLDIDAGTLAVRLGGELATRIPLVPLERVVLRGNAVLSTRVLAELWRHDIGLLLLSGRHNEATARLVGRDPLLGFLHVPERGRESLASDLVEPLRPHVDEWVWRSFAERLVRGEHFSREKGGACLMGKAGRWAFYNGFEPLAAGLRRLL